MRTKEEYELVCKLYCEGYNKSQIEKETGIPRGTVKDWLKSKPKNFEKIEQDSELKKEIINNRNLHKHYSYILGLYLGDGYINKCKRTFRIRIFLDVKYLNLNNFAKESLEKIFVNNNVNVLNSKNKSCICLSIYNSNLNELFPQNGKGKKSDRKIELEKWQKEIIVYEDLIKGLIHSDGCFYSEKIDDKYNYERFMFSNKSIDLHEIFQQSCDYLKIEYDFQHKGNVKGNWQTRISKKESVKKLKQFIGTKEMPI